MIEKLDKEKYYNLKPLHQTPIYGDKRYDREKLLLDKINELVDQVNKSTKPILLIKMPASTSLEMIHQSHRYVEGKKIDVDYHVLIVSNGDKEEVDVEVYNSNDIKEEEFNQLKQLIKDGFTSKSNQQE